MHLPLSLFLLLSLANITAILLEEREGKTGFLKSRGLIPGKVSHMNRRGYNPRGGKVKLAENRKVEEAETRLKRSK